MKTRKTNTMTKSFIVILMVFGFFTTNAQNSKPVMTVLNISTNGVGYSPAQCGDMVRFELDKLAMYDVLMRNDINNLLWNNGINIDSCYSRECLLKTGAKIKSEYIAGGSVELIGGKIVVRIRILNIANSSTEKSIVEEYLHNESEIPQMIHITIQKLYSLTYSDDEYKRLTQLTFEGKSNNPGINKLTLSGPRVGLIFLTGNSAERMTADTRQGGFGMNRTFMTMFGYQQEIQYLNEGKFQALFEFIPAISGIDQNRFIPSLTFMNGFRNNSSGWEIAFGPSVTLNKTANGYYDSQGVWQMEGTIGYNPSSTDKIINQTDSRGEADVDFSFILGFGKTIRSGSMNMPLNVFVVTSKNDYRFGATFGFNSKKSGN